MAATTEGANEAESKTGPKKLTPAMIEAAAEFNRQLDQEIAHAKFYANVSEKSEAERKAMRESVVGPSERFTREGNPVNLPPKTKALFEAFDRAQSVVDLGMRKDKETGELVEAYKPALKMLLTNASSERISHRVVTGDKSAKLSLQERFYVNNANAVDKSVARHGAEKEGMIYLSLDVLRENVRKNPQHAETALKALKATIGESRRVLGDLGRDQNRERRAKEKEAEGQSRG